MLVELIIMLLVVAVGVILSTRKDLSLMPLPEKEESLYGDLEHHTLYAEPNYMPMSFFSRNRTSMSCCPSVYSSNGGCICMTPEQATVLSDRSQVSN